MDAAADQYRVNRRADQEYYVEVWCEKDALSSILAPLASELHVTYMAQRGYSSATAMYNAAKRFESHLKNGRTPVVVYLGDHDPSGVDMPRDLQSRQDMLCWAEVVIYPVALTLDQVDEHQLPPNPTK